MPGRRFGPLDYVIRGVRLLIGRSAIISSPMLDNRCVKKWMFSQRTVRVVRITAGTSWKGVCVLMLTLATAPALLCRWPSMITRKVVPLVAAQFIAPRGIRPSQVLIFTETGAAEESGACNR